MQNKPFAESCEQNKQVILDTLRPLLRDSKSVFEIGSGTGQHAVYFASQLPHLQWHTSELREHIPGIRLWLQEAALKNLHPPVEFNVNQRPWPLPAKVDAVFSANTLHIMSWASVEQFFAGLGETLNAGAQLIVYGPFNFAGRYTSESNARFDAWLKNRDPQSGVRNFEDLCQQAEQHELAFVEDIPMPANNRILVWRKSA